MWMKPRMVVMLSAAALAAVGATFSTAVTTHAVPTCPGTDRTICGGRIIPEAMQSAGFLTYSEWQAAMTELQKEHPDRVRFDDIGHTAGGRPVYEVIVTDFADPSPLSARHGLYFNGDIHGDERDGTEGFARAIEDLAETTDPALMSELHHEVLVFTDANPDGWQCGDVPDAATQSAASCQQAQACYQSGANGCPAGAPTTPPVTEFTRINAATHDLNREWPVVGYQNTTTFPLTDPEVQSIVQAHGNLLHRHLGVTFSYGFDVHGSATVETPPTAQLMLDVLLSAGQFDIKRSMLQTQLFAQYMSNLSATTNDNILATVGGASGQQVYRVGEWDTSWDIYGYLVSGGYADFQANQWTGLGAVTGTIELWINGEPGQENTFLGFSQLVEASNVHSMRVAVRTAMDLAGQAQQATVTVPGSVAVIDNGFSLQAGAGSGSTTPVGDATTRPPGKPYPATTNTFFSDLAPYADHPVVQLAAAAVTSASQLTPYASVVVAQDPHLGDASLIAALTAYARGGGTIILTDAALQDLSAMGLVPAAAVGHDLVYAGYVDVDHSDPLAKDIRPLSRQTYEPVPVGYPIDNTFSSSQSTVHAPAWWVDQTAWQTAGGRSAGTTGTSKTSLGEIPTGSGRVRILGSLLPDPSGDATHPFGVSDYAVTYGGYQLFLNLLGAGAKLSPPIVESGPLTTLTGPASSVPDAPGTALLALTSSAAAVAAVTGRSRARRRRRTRA
jgi:hypothetical protein